MEAMKGKRARRKSKRLRTHLFHQDGKREGRIGHTSKAQQRPCLKFKARRHIILQEGSWGAAGGARSTQEVEIGCRSRGRARLCSLLLCNVTTACLEPEPSLSFVLISGSLSLSLFPNTNLSGKSKLWTQSLRPDRPQSRHSLDPRANK